MNGLLQSVTRLDSNGAQVAKTTFNYDAHGRQYQVVDERNGTTEFTFDDLDRIVTITTPAPGTGQSSQTSTNHYDYYGRGERVDFADGGSVTNEYFNGGELKKRTGSRTYPVEFSYDYAGRKETMKTWQDYAASSGMATTTWKYDGYRGWLTNKTYQTTNGPSYTYTLGGRLKTRTWARGVTTTYSTNYFGDIIGLDYSEEATPDLSFIRDRLGRPIAVTNGSSVTTINYNDAGQILSETRDGLTVTNAYDSLLRLSAVGYDDADADAAEYAFDAASRLSSLTHGLNTADYNYLENSSLISDIAFRTNGNLRMSANRQYDNLNRLTSVSSVPSASSAVSFAYAHNLANQRTNVTIGPDNSSWRYGYDDLGQVTSGKKYWPDSTPVAGQQFEYEFDDIGNRLWTKAGGDASGGSMRLANYTNNLLNQITGRGVPGTNDVIGIAHASATVTINGQSTYRKGEYYQLAIGTNNTSPVSLWVTNLATLGTNSQSVTGRFFLASAGQHFSYDADGNLLTNSRSYYYWDAENRLKLVIGWYPSDSRFRLDCAYDYLDRRISKCVSNWTGSAFVLDYERKFLYQGWNLVAELDGTNGLLKTHHWGTDASGTMQGAGGVGGLLATVFHTGQYAGTYFPAYDGNWNAVKYIRASDGAAVAEYAFGPFGELLRASGPMAKEFNFLFSTKYYDWEIALYYYGYRYYDPSTGRWLSRDPIEERGGAHLYGMALNNPLTEFDYLGLWPVEIHKRIIDRWLLNITSHGKFYLFGETKVFCCKLNVKALLNAGSDEVDGFAFNIPLTSLQIPSASFFEDAHTSEGAYMHGMKGPTETVAQARNNFDSFIHQKIRNAHYYSEQARQHRRCAGFKIALRQLGMAFHAYTDSLDPSHSGFQTWWGPVDGSLAFGPLGYADFVNTHKSAETLDAYLPLEAEIIKKVTARFQEDLNSIMKEWSL